MQKQCIKKKTRKSILVARFHYIRGGGQVGLRQVQVDLKSISDNYPELDPILIAGEKP